MLITGNLGFFSQDVLISFSDLLATVQPSVQSVQPFGVQPGGPELIHFEIDPEIGPSIGPFWS